jgi:hypothetical protein
MFHGFAAPADEAQTIGKAHGLGGYQRRNLAQRMTGRESGGLVVDLGAERRQGGDGADQQRRLEIGRIVQVSLRPLPAQLRQLEAQDVIGLGKDLPRRRKGLRQRVSHAHKL